MNNDKDERLPKHLPDDWVFPPPPVSTAYWLQSDWVAYAAPYNESKWKVFNG